MVILIKHWTSKHSNPEWVGYFIKSMVMHVIICIPLGILLCADCMNYLELITQDYFVILLVYHMSNITLNVHLLGLLTMQSFNKKVNILVKMCISNTLCVTGCKISNILCDYKISMYDIMYGNNVCAFNNEQVKYNI